MKKLILLTVLGTMLLTTGCAKKGLTESTENGIRFLDTDKKTEETTYVTETTYDGNSLPSELYDLSFKSSENAQYVPNTELTEYIGGEENILPYLNSANNALMLTFAQNGYSIQEESYIKNVSSLYQSTQGLSIGDTVYSPEEYALHMYDLYVDNRISVKGNFESDASLFWQNNYMYYVRGVLTLTLEEDANGAYFKEFGIPLNSGNKTISLIVHVRFMPGNADEILGIDILGEI